MATNEEAPAVTSVDVLAKRGEATVQIPSDFAGQIVLHCNQGRVEKVQVNNVQRPRTEDPVEITEGAA